MKIIRVGMCYVCPLRVEHWCEHPNPSTKYRDIEDDGTIPKWCPLEDEQSEDEV